MARTVSGSGAVIEPIFDEVFGVRAVKVVNGGTGYTSADPPRLTVTGCGTPTQEAILYPIIDQDSGRIIHVRVLDRGKGYDPLRLGIYPQAETPNVVDSFDINKIWQSHPNSPTSGLFALNSASPPQKTDRLRIQSDNHPKPTPTQAERVPGGGPLVDRSFDQTFIYRGGKDVPNPGTREAQPDKVTGILANGGLLHTPEWGPDGNPFPGFALDSVKHSYVKDNTVYDAVVENNVSYYQSSRVLNEFKLKNGTFEFGNLRQFTWNIKVEFDNIMLTVTNIDESIGTVEVGRTVDVISGNGRGEIARIVRDGGNNITRIYLRQTSGTFNDQDLVLGSTGFGFKINTVPIALTNGIFYIDFGTDSDEFGAFIPGTYYFAPQNIKVQRNYLIIWNQSDSTNGVTGTHTQGHPMQFSTTADGLLNGGTLYYNSTSLDYPAADYENEFQPLLIMNADENTNRIYYYCKYHRYMSGYAGDEGYITFETTIDNDPLVNDYYVTDFYATGPDYSRHADGHSKIVGMSFDGYPIYGPYGYTSTGTIAKEISGFRFKTTGELDGGRPEVITPSTETFVVTVSSGKFLFGGTTPPFLDLKRGKTYVFQQNDASNDNEILLISSTEDGWHAGVAGTASYVYTTGVKYYLESVEKTYAEYLAGFDAATARELRFTVPSNSTTALYTFAETTASVGVRTVQEGYVLGDVVQDHIWDNSPTWDSGTAYAQYATVRNSSGIIYEATAAISSGGSQPVHTSGTTSNWKYVQPVGTLDAYNGKFGVTPEYPNGTYAYFMTEDGAGTPVFPYVIGPRFYGVPLFEGDTPPDANNVFPAGAEGEVVLSTDNPGTIAYVKMTQKGDNYFGSATARILGGTGSGATASPVVQTITGLSLLNGGRQYASPPTLIFEGGGGSGAEGAAAIDTLGKVTSISIVDSGEYYQEPPYILINGGGGLGAKAVATISQGSISSITVTDQGKGYTSQPTVIFTKLVNLKRKTRARQAYNSGANYLTGLVKDMTASDTSIYVDSTDAYPGSGKLIINKETISYTSKAAGKFSGITRGVNFNYDQRVILDSGQNAEDGTSNYKFSVGDRVIRRVENAGNKVAKVYDWDPSTRELLVTFEVDELAFIDAGIPSTEDAIVQFDAGVADSATSAYQPHTIIDAQNEVITTLTVPISTLQDKAFQDILPTSIGDGIPDLVNTGTDFENQIQLDGGIFSSLYGIEETLGGQNTTLFQVGDSIKDGDIPFKYATISSAGGLSDGVEHTALTTLYLDNATGNGGSYNVNEIVTGSISGVQGTVVSWDTTNQILVLKAVTPFNTGNINVGVNGLLYEFSHNSSIIDFIIQNPGTNYSAVPLLEIQGLTSPTSETRNAETINWGGPMGDIQATGTAVMTAAGDQVASINITNGGYGYKKTIDSSYYDHPYVLFTDSSNNILDGKFNSTSSGAIAQAVLGGELCTGTGGASYRIKRIEYQTQVRA